MSRDKCLTPIPHPKLLGFSLPCRKCTACLMYLRLEWANRMKMECYQASRPFFCTWTFAPENYSNSEADCKADIQKFWKKLRKAGHDIRYFTVIERGEHNNRLHGHSIIWSESLFRKTPKQAFEILKSVWGKGIVDMQPLRSPAGLNYVVKYLIKDLSDEGQRNYSWSQKPMLGESGRRYWESLVHHYHEQGVLFNLDNMPPNHFQIPILGEVQDIYVPRQYYVDFCKAIGIEFNNEPYKTPPDWDPLEL